MNALKENDDLKFVKAKPAHHLVIHYYSFKKLVNITTSPIPRPSFEYRYSQTILLEIFFSARVRHLPNVPRVSVFAQVLVITFERS